MIAEWLGAGERTESRPTSLLMERGVRVSPLYESTHHREWLAAKKAEARSPTIAVVRSVRTDGTWEDVEIIKFNAGVPEVAGLEPAEVTAFRDAYAAVKIGVAKSADLDGAPPDATNAEIAEALRMPPEAREGEVFFFRDAGGAVVFAHQRVEVDGRKVYVAWHLREIDGEPVWFASEPEGPLPLYGADRLPGAGGKVVVIHESARAAEFGQRIADGHEPDHIWAEELAGTVNAGWIGGALNVERIDWAPVNNALASRVVIVADNDEEGCAAVPKIAKALFLPTYAICFHNAFPKGFDMAEPYPEAARLTHDGKRKPLHLQRLSIMERFATWATDIYHLPGSTKRHFRVRRPFAREVAYIKTLDRYVVRSQPDHLFKPMEFDRTFRAYSDTSQLSGTVVEDAETIFDKLTFKPGNMSREVMLPNGSKAINTWQPSLIPRRRGDTSLFEGFMRYLVPGEEDRLNLLRLIATMVARPSQRIIFSVLLISIAEGVGKNTLTDAILKPLVGEHNTSVVGESGITGSFNGWAANKRLVIVPEIYEGHSFTTANKLKSIVTDDEIMVNEKNQPSYNLDNHITFFACSNSMEALKIAEVDRRWFVPGLTDTPAPRELFVKLHAALASGDLLPAIMDWAHTYGHYVEGGETAPGSAMKAEVIAGSRGSTDASLKNLIRLAQSASVAADEHGEPVAYRARLKEMMGKLPTDGRMNAEGRAANKAACEFLQGIVDGLIPSIKKTYPIPLAMTSREVAAHLKKWLLPGERDYLKEPTIRSIMKKAKMVDAVKAGIDVGEQRERVMLNAEAAALVARAEAEFDGDDPEPMKRALYRAMLVFPSRVMRAPLVDSGEGEYRPAQEVNPEWEADA
jgi:hypothetical protein